MKKIYIKQLLTAILLLCSTVVQATTFKVDDFSYTITDETNLTVEVGYTNREVEEVIIPSSITYEGKTYTVTGILYSGFYYCSKLTKVTIPESVTTIGGNAFRRCSSLTEIVIPEGVTTIKEGTFELCSALTEIVIPEGVTTIGVNAFANCSALKEVTIPKSVKTVGSGAFSGCTAITTVNISDLKAWCEINFGGALDYYNSILMDLSANPLFNWVSSPTDNIYGGWNPEFSEPRDLVLNGEIIKDLVIPANVYSIAGHFIGCSAESVSFEHPDENMPADIGYRIGEYSFGGMKNLKKVVLPDFYAAIGCAAFYECTSLEELVINKNYLWGFEENISSWANLPQEIETFQGCTHLKKLTIKEGVNTLEDIFGTQFSYHPAGKENDILEIETLQIPNLSTIEPIIKANTIDYTTEAAWYNSTLDLSGDCKVLIAGKPVKEKSGELIIPDGVTAIYGEKINGANITKVVLPGSVTHIHNNAFADCTELSEINIPESVTYIGKGAFDNTAIYNNCTDNLLYIDNWLVGYKSDNLGDITIKEGTKDMAGSIFADCTHLTGIKLPNSISHINDETFRGCTALAGFDFGPSITQIGASAFEGCTALTSITIPENIAAIPHRAFYGSTSLTEINFHSGITKIESEAFHNTAWYNNRADGLLYLNNRLIGYKGDFAQDSLIIEEGTIGIADGAAFRNLSTIVMPKSLAYIGANAFVGQNRDCDVITYATTPPTLEENSFYETGRYDIIVSIGKGILEAYQEAKYWNEFYNIDAYSIINNIKYVPVSDDDRTVAISKYYGNDTTLDIPATAEFNGVAYNVVAINSSAFYGNTTLTSITIPASVTSIGMRAFMGCSALTNINIPNSVTIIEESAFSDCRALESINLPTGLETIMSNTFYNCTALKNIDIPNGVTTIEASAFSNCSALTRIYIPESVQTISTAFNGCENITEIYSNSATPASILAATFDRDTQTGATLYIPTGTLSEYTSIMMRRTWGRFSNIVEMDFTGINNIEAEDSFQGIKDAYYELNGRIAANPTKGIYIRNGKKIVIE